MSVQIPYHLRTNKNVERILFTELLRRIGPHLKLRTERYCYVGMGGPLLQDFAAVQGVFGCNTMISLETDEHVLRRQEFNQPHCRIKLQLKSTGKFADEYVAGLDPLLVWFDYTKPDWKTQIQEVCTLLPKVPELSIIKISLPIINSALPCSAKDGESVLYERLEKLKGMFPGLAEFTEKDVVRENWVHTVFRLLQLCVANALPDSPGRVCRPLAAYRYSDGTEMLTVTLFVGPQSDVDEVKRLAQLKTWAFSDLDWKGPLDIEIPEISVRERLAIERHLPDQSCASIHDELNLRFAPSVVESRAVLARFIKFAQHVPYFLKATV